VENDSLAAFRETAPLDSTLFRSLSPATKLLLNSLDNYLEVDPQSDKVRQILLLRGHTFYNNSLFAEARKSYISLYDKFPQAPEKLEAMQMTAQSFYEQKRFGEAQQWYKIMAKQSQGGESKTGVEERIAETYYFLAETAIKRGDRDGAIENYERLVREYPKVRIADVALFNAGLLCEEKQDWSRSILTFNKLLANYETSVYRKQSLFHMATDYEKMGNFSKAAGLYMELVKAFPGDSLVPDAFYNAGIAYEKDNKMGAAATIYEKYTDQFPAAPDAPDVLFKAAELYGKLEMWQDVERVNSNFGKRYGNDQNRIVQALCMVGVASFNQRKFQQAIQDFEKTLRVFKEIGNQTKQNLYYAAQAEYQLGEIYKKFNNDIKLSQKDQNAYRQQMAQKNSLLKQAIDHFTNVTNYKLLNWTTRALFSLGESFEDFGVAIYQQDRPANQKLEKMLGLEAGIAEAVELYLVERSLPHYLQNVDYGIQNQYTDEWIEKSKNKLTALCFLAANNYTRLVELLDRPPEKNLQGIGLLNYMLGLLQDISPYQEKAIGLYLRSVELGTKYQVNDKYIKLASAQVTGTACKVGQNLSDIVDITRGAPIPAQIKDDPYTYFLYRYKLLSEALPHYETKAIEAYYKTIKIALAYQLQDDWVEKARADLARILFNRARCYDILGQIALQHPPYPLDASDEEKEEYTVQFEELGFKLQEESNSSYRLILAKAKENAVKGTYLRLAYARLYQIFPKEVGVTIERDTVKILETDREWVFSAKSRKDWMEIDADQEGWEPVHPGVVGDSVTVSGFSDSLPAVLWGGEAAEPNSIQLGGRTISYKPLDRIYFRRLLESNIPPKDAVLEWTSSGETVITINGQLLKDPAPLALPPNWYTARKWNISEYLKKGTNIIGVEVKNPQAPHYAFQARVYYRDANFAYWPQFPDETAPLPPEKFRETPLPFPDLINFGQPDAKAAAPAGKSG
jgi:TolA-binding protein